MVEYSINRLLPLITAEKKKHRQRKMLLKDLNRYLEEGDALLRHYRGQLGGDDAVYQKLENAVSALADACSDIDNQIEKGKIIENF
jgi:hypothetical protein